ETITTTAADGTVTTEVLDFAYDAQGIPYSLTYTNGTASPVTYYYITNLQGDVMQLIDSAGETKATYSYDPYGQVLRANGAMAEINPLQYRGYYYDSDSNLYYLQSRYYDANVCRFINADSYASTGQGFLGCNMFAYCRNNPANRTDLGGYADEAAQEKTGQNMENMLAFFGVDSPEGLPEMPDDCMVFLENTWTFPIYGTSFVHGTSIVMDADKYCTYSFWGFSLGASGIPYDFSVTKGYVYGVENTEDFCGNFYGTAFNGVADIEGGAWARNGVHSEIICGNGFMSASAGFSITRYDTPQKSWKYGKAKINWYNNPHNPFGARQIVEI
ncbi:MAG: RHS repeat-associated core domain-containing protein, partial [Oscillospiraceae bacterium]